jgi:hypothetical protein
MMMMMMMMWSRAPRACPSMASTPAAIATNTRHDHPTHRRRRRPPATATAVTAATATAVTPSSPRYQSPCWLGGRMLRTPVFSQTTCITTHLLLTTQGETKKEKINEKINKNKTHTKNIIGTTPTRPAARASARGA